MGVFRKSCFHVSKKQPRQGYRKPHIEGEISSKATEKLTGIAQLCELQNECLQLTEGEGDWRACLGFSLGSNFPFKQSCCFSGFLRASEEAGRSNSVLSPSILCALVLHPQTMRPWCQTVVPCSQDGDGRHRCGQHLHGDRCGRSAWFSLGSLKSVVMGLRVP